MCSSTVCYAEQTADVALQVCCCVKREKVCVCQESNVHKHAVTTMGGQYTGSASQRLLARIFKGLSESHRALDVKPPGRSLPGAISVLDESPESVLITITCRRRTAAAPAFTVTNYFLGIA